MKQVYFFATVFAIAGIIGCGTKPGEAQADGTTTTSPINVNNLSTATIPSGTTPQPIAAPNLNIPTTTTTTTAPATTSSAAGLNPAHGQPGHRCDIPVGQPLNSAPSTATTNKTATTQPPVITTSSPTITTTQTQVKTAPGMNPPHGQPGHRCDIAVGQPLNSKPATTTPTVTTTPVNSVASTSPTVTTTPVTTVAPGMNPAHGQPGHRCDIAVGAPLNSKPEPLKVAPSISTEKTEVKKEN